MHPSRGPSGPSLHLGQTCPSGLCLGPRSGASETAGLEGGGREDSVRNPTCSLPCRPCAAPLHYEAVLCVRTLLGAAKVFLLDSSPSSRPVHLFCTDGVKGPISSYISTASRAQKKCANMRRATRARACANSQIRTRSTYRYNGYLKHNYEKRSSQLCFW